MVPDEAPLLEHERQVVSVVLVASWPLAPCLRKLLAVMGASSSFAQTSASPQKGGHCASATS